MPTLHDLEPQRFHYSRRLGFGIQVNGEGEIRRAARFDRRPIVRADILVRRAPVNHSGAEHVASIGTGVMDEIWKGRFYTEPFLRIGARRLIMFPETGCNVPFRIENYAFVDRFGRETISWIRTFQSQRTRRFDASMIYSEGRGRIVDYLGSHQHLAVDMCPSGGRCSATAAASMLNGRR